MKPKKVLFLVTILILLNIVWAIPSLAQDASPSPTDTPIPTITPTQAAFVSASDVAILVVDIFEEDPSVTHVVDDEEQCGSPFDGLNGPHIQGNIISSALHPYVLSHGRLVYMSLQDEIERELGATRTSRLPVGWTNHPEIPTVEQWETQTGGHIWLVAVEANGYEIDSIAANIDIAIDAMKATTDRFVINMSFGVVPCKEIPTILPVQYKSYLEDLGIACDDNSIGLPALRCTIDALVPNEEPNIQEFVTGLVKYRDSSVVNAATFAFFQQAIARPLAFQGFQNEVDPLSENLVNKINDIGSINEVKIIQVASAGNDSLDYPYYPANAPNVLSVSADYTHGDCKYYKDEAKLRHFLSTTLKFPDDMAIPSINRILFPPSNDGEVDENGVSNIPPEVYLKAIYIAPTGITATPGAGATATPSPTPSPTPTPLPRDLAAEQEAFEAMGCLTGTSFSAPRVSLKMAVHFLASDLTTCSGKFGISSPPFDHKEWNNLSVLEARNRYCHEFSGLAPFIP